MWQDIEIHRQGIVDATAHLEASLNGIVIIALAVSVVTYLLLRAVWRVFTHDM